MAADIVCLVDDNAAERDVLRRLLLRNGLKVETFSCSREFFSAYIPGQVGCVVSEMRLPDGVNGLDILDRLTHDYGSHKTPVIIATGGADVPVAVRAVKSGVFDFLVKPIDQRHFLTKVREAVATNNTRHLPCTSVAQQPLFHTKSYRA